MKSRWLVVVSIACALVLATRADGISVSRDSYAAIAYSPATGKIGLAYNLRSRKSAEKAALEDCGADDARVVCWVNRGFCALALGDDKSCWGMGVDYGDGASNNKANAAAIDDCRRRTTRVHVVAAMSSDGQYLWKPTRGAFEGDPSATGQGTVDEKGNMIVPGLGGMTFAPNGDILAADGRKLYDGEKKAWTPESKKTLVPVGTPSPSPSATEEPKRATPTPSAANEIEFNPEPAAVLPRRSPTRK